MTATSIATTFLDLYGALPRTCHPQPSGSSLSFTVLAGFALVCGNTIKPISLATGCKVLPQSKLPPCGDVLHDSHAEIIARRGAVMWLSEEMQRASKDGHAEWIERGCEGSWRLREGVTLAMYISCLPCGDASTLWLAENQDAEMASVKADHSISLPSESPLLARGRDGYSSIGVLRTKPGRADSPPTLSMSCSDKIASWSVLGVQGALLSTMMDPVYISDLVIGGVPKDWESRALGECRRAFSTRLGNLTGLLAPFSIHEPRIHFTSIPFPDSKEEVALRSDPTFPPVSSNDSLSWIANSGPVEMLVNGIRKGASLKRRTDHEPLRPSSRSRLCKLSMFELFIQTRTALGLPDLPAHLTYYQAKHDLPKCQNYQRAKGSLRGPPESGEAVPFGGWVVSGEAWESFTREGQVVISSGR